MDELMAELRGRFVDTTAANKSKVDAALTKIENYDADLDCLETFEFNESCMLGVKTIDKFLRFVQENCERIAIAEKKLDAAMHPASPELSGGGGIGGPSMNNNNNNNNNNSKSTSSSSSSSSGSNSNTVTGDFKGNSNQNGTSQLQNRLLVSPGKETSDFSTMNNGTKSSTSPADTLAIDSVNAQNDSQNLNGDTMIRAKPVEKKLCKTKFSMPAPNIGLANEMQTKLSLNDTLQKTFAKDPVEVDMNYRIRGSANTKFIESDMIARVQATTDRIEDLSKLYQSRLPASEDVVRGVVGGLNQGTSEVAVVGRVLPDQDSAVKINEQSLMIEGSRESCNGKRIQFLTSEAQRVVAFPGSIVQAIGRMEQGARFHANVVQTGIPVPARSTSESNSMNPRSQDPVHIVCACGPYTKSAQSASGTAIPSGLNAASNINSDSSQTLDYTPLVTLMEHLLAQQPQICILMGPFVDSNNLIIQEGGIVSEDKLDMDFVDIAEQVVLPLLQEFTIRLKDSCNCEVIIVPSIYETGFFYPTPQPPYPQETLTNLWEDLENTGVRFAQNPCFIRVNDSFTISCTSQDPLTPLIKTTIMRPEIRGLERFDEIMRLLLLQRSWFPRDGYDRANPMDVNVDQAQREQYEFLYRKAKSKSSNDHMNKDSEISNSNVNGLNLNQNVDVAETAVQVKKTPIKVDYDMFADTDPDVDIQMKSAKRARDDKISSSESESKNLASNNGNDIDMLEVGATSSRKDFDNSGTDYEIDDENDYTVEDNIPDVLLFSANVGVGYAARKVDDRIFVNCGSICKKAQTGTFSEIWIHPGSKEFSRVEIKKLPDI